MDDRLARIEMNHDKLSAHFKGIEDTMGTNQLGSRKPSFPSSNYIGRTPSEPVGALIGDT